MLAPLVTIGLCGLLSTAAHGGDDDGRRTGAKPPPPCPCDDPSLCRPLSPQPSADRDEVVAFSSWTFNGEPNRHNYTAPQHFDWSKITTWAPFEVDETGPDGDQYAEMFCTCLRDTCLPAACTFSMHTTDSHTKLFRTDRHGSQAWSARPRLERHATGQHNPRLRRATCGATQLRGHRVLWLGGASCSPAQTCFIQTGLGPHKCWGLIESETNLIAGQRARNGNTSNLKMFNQTAVREWAQETAECIPANGLDGVLLDQEAIDLDFNQTGKQSHPKRTA